MGKLIVKITHKLPFLKITRVRDQLENIQTKLYYTEHFTTEIYQLRELD